jgi:hypothetical protein
LRVCHVAACSLPVDCHCFLQLTEREAITGPAFQRSTEYFTIKRSANSAPLLAKLSHNQTRTAEMLQWSRNFISNICSK